MVRLRAVLLCMLLAGIAAACTTPRPPAPAPTVTTLAIVPTATSASLTDLPQLPLPAAESVTPSPDGTRLAALDSAGTTLTLYDQAGTVYGQYHDPAGGPLGVWWLADSSGVCITSYHPPFSMRIMDRSGTVHSTAFDDISGPLLSPDGQWIAGTLGSSTATQDVVEIGPRDGGAVRRLPPGSDFLGWLDGQMAYVTQQAIYLAPPAGGSARVIASAPPRNTREVADAAAAGEMVSSPDDQVLIVQVLYTLEKLTSMGLTQLPIRAILPGFWVGPHAALGAVGANGAVGVIDMLTGATIQKTPATLAGNQPQTVSGSWIAAIEFGQPAQLFVINYQTGVSQYLGLLPPSGPIVPLGPHGRFLVHTTNGPSYVASAT